MVNVQYILDIIILTISFSSLNFFFHNKKAGSTSNNDKVAYMDTPKDKHCKLCTKHKK